MQPEEALIAPQKANIRRLETELRRAKIELKAEKIKTNKLSSALKHNDSKYKKQQEATDAQLGAMISKLLLLEGELRREQQDIEETMQVKDKTISWQGQRISRLERVNAQLTQEVTQLKGDEEDKKRAMDTTIKSVKACSLETLNEETIC